MAWSVLVKSRNLPLIHEPLVIFEGCPYDIITASQTMGFPQLSKQSSPTIVQTLQKMIEEIDKANLGCFSDEWCIQRDQCWSQGKDSEKSWKNIQELKKTQSVSYYMESYSAWTGYVIRNKMRDQALKLFLYYKSGYDVVFIG